MRTSSQYEERNHSVQRFDFEDEIQNEIDTGLGDIFLGAWIGLLCVAALAADHIADGIYYLMGWM